LVDARNSASRKIANARAATAKMDAGLEPAIERLLRALQVGNGAGVYADVSAVRGALAGAGAAITIALAVAVATDWPTNEDYDQC
jgi:hypothetical protein